MDKELVARSADARRNALTTVNDKFGVADSIQHLQQMMRGVTAKDFNAGTVNAAVGCVSQINETIRTAIQAAKFLAEK